MNIFEPYHIGPVKLKNRVIRSATYEGRCDHNGFPSDDFYSYYEELACSGTGGIITGFAFTSPEGKAMQDAQAGIDEDEKIPHFRKLTSLVHRYDCPVFIQISNSGRQSLSSVTHKPLRGASSKRSFYFQERPLPLKNHEVYERIEEYGHAAYRAKVSGFDGVQVHAAHGYLIHQFLLPSVNNRKDEFGSGQGTHHFLEKVVETIRNYCGQDYPVLVKISSGATGHAAFGIREFDALVRKLDQLRVTAIEISYGTMDHPLNIFRGDFPVDLILKWNPILRSDNPLKKLLHKLIIKYWYLPRQLPFSPMYNLEAARRAKTLTRIPVISVGGFRNGRDIQTSLENGSCDLVGLSRPFIAEPDFILKIINNIHHQSSCCNCNYCAIMCDSGRRTKCYMQQPNNRDNESV